MNKVNIANYIVYDLANRLILRNIMKWTASLSVWLPTIGIKSTLYRAPKTLNSTTVNKFGRNL